MARILILTPQLPYPPQALTGLAQGTTIRNYNLLARLACHHELDLATFAGPDDETGATSGAPGEYNATALLGPYCRSIVIEHAPRRSQKRRGRDTLFSPLPDMALRLACPAMHQRLAHLMSANHYHIIQAEGIEMAPYALRLQGQTTQAYLPEESVRPLPPPCLVFDDHNAEYVLQKRAFATDVQRPRRWLAAAYSLIQWQKLRAYERRVCRAADRVVAVSHPDRQALRRLIPGLDVAVVPNGVDLDFYRPGIVPPLPEMSREALVFTGKMDYRPNVDAVLWFANAVLPAILAQIPAAHLYVVGQQPHPRLAALAGHPAITITGRVPDTRPYIAGAAVYLVPLRIGGGTRLKVLEAMAMGQAIVSTRLGCDGFEFEAGREVHFADEPAAFAAAVVDLMQDREEAIRLGRAARAYVEAHFGWDTIVPLLEALYP